jgi:hypothetical protein
MNEEIPTRKNDADTSNFDQKLIDLVFLICPSYLVAASSPTFSSLVPTAYPSSKLILPEGAARPNLESHLRPLEIPLQSKECVKQNEGLVN